MKPDFDIFKRYGAKGGRKRWRNTSKADRKKAMRKLARKRWNEKVS
ncbi:MAG: hypothetical protein WC655_04115 [Candidatus Hydrogenedentales bacterium]